MPLDRKRWAPLVAKCGHVMLYRAESNGRIGFQQAAGCCRCQPNVWGHTMPNWQSGEECYVHNVARAR